jgi:2-methylcitrate dehydratase PrpD
MNYSVDVGITNHRDAFPAIVGVLSALLAQRGITGIKDCLESKAGLYNLYFKGSHNPSFLTDNLGERFEGIQVGIKAFPGCAAMPTYITATLDIVREHDIHPEDVAEITVFFNDRSKHFCEPLGERRKPPNRMDASLSLPFGVASAVAKRKLNIGSFITESLKDPITLEVAQKVMTRFAPELNAPLTGGARPGVVAIKTRNENHGQEG